MNRKERFLIIVILALICGLTTVDLLTDFDEGVPWWHVGIEAVVALFALFGVFFLLSKGLLLKSHLAREKYLSARALKESHAWKTQAKKYIQGLSATIDEQLDVWQLTPSEKEVAFLLIKGLSLKEIAELRKTTEKTTRAQATTIYSKARLSGRSQLSAFFLEDLLAPSMVPPEHLSGPDTTERDG